MKKVRPQLKHAQFHITNRCNLNCLFCWYHYNKEEYENISSETLMGYLKEVCDMRPESITLSGGGEPLCRANVLLNMMKLIKKDYPKISGVLITNATLLNKKFVNSMVKIGWDDMIISIQAQNPKINDFIMGKKGAFKKAVKGIDLVNETKKRLGKKKPVLSIKTVITKYNYKFVLEMIRLAEKLRIKNIEFRMVNEEGEEDLAIPSSEIRKFTKLIRKIKERSKSLNVNLEFDIEGLEIQNKQYLQKIKNVQKNVCLIPFTELVVFGNGAISVCCNYFKNQFKADSKAVVKNNKRSIKELWQNEFQKMRENINDAKLYPLCQRCSKDMVNRNKNIKL